MQSANNLFSFILFRWGRRFLAFSFCLFFAPSLLQAQLFLPPVNYQAGIAPRCMVAKDFNGDGKLDIATSDWGGNTVSVLIGNGLGAFSSPTAYPVGQVPQRIASADINADGYMDLVTTNFSSNSLSVLYGLGNGQFSQADSIYVGLKPYDLVFADFNLDGHPDLVATLYGQNSLVLLLGTGNTGFSAPLPLLTNGAGPYRLCAGDFNADGNPDFVLFSWITGNFSVRLGNGMGGFTTANIYPGGYIGELVPCDFNGDGKLDLSFVTHYGSGIVLGDGSGGLIMGSVPPLLPNVGLGTGLCIADFNEDGKLDLVHTNVPADTLDVHLGMPGFDSLSYTPQEKIFSVGGSSPYFLLSADFNGDGHADIASANEGATNITVYLNALPQTTPNATSGISLENTQFTLYPNPAKERVFLYLPSQHTKSITVEMYDFTARKVKTYSETTKDQHISMPLDDLLSGIYTIEIYSEQEHIGHQTLQILH